jgi:hypothetical protein
VTKLRQTGLCAREIDAAFASLVQKRTATIIGVLLNPSNPNVEFRLRELREAAHSLRQFLEQERTRYPRPEHAS